MQPSLVGRGPATFPAQPCCLEDISVLRDTASELLPSFVRGMSVVLRLWPAKAGHLVRVG